MVVTEARCMIRGTDVEESGQPDAPPSEWTAPSWEDVVLTHSARVYRLAYRLTGNRHDAEDLTQEVFVRVFRSLASYTPGTFEGWLHRITTNLFLDMARRRQRIRFEGLGQEMAGRIEGGNPTPAQAFDERHLDSDIQAALARLAPEYRAAVVLCDIEGLSYEEIAATLGVKLGTVRSRIHRGRAQLRSALEHRRPRGAGGAGRRPGPPGVRTGRCHDDSEVSQPHAATGGPGAPGPASRRAGCSLDGPAGTAPEAPGHAPSSRPGRRERVDE
jgi:RNA polymerase sigma factor (sigma-70 family)